MAGKEREKAFAKQNADLTIRYNEHSKELKPIECKTQVIIQENGRWFRVGRVVEALPNRQYLIKLGGSGRLTLRNRRFLKPCKGQKTPEIIPSPLGTSNPPKHTSNPQDVNNTPAQQSDPPAPDTPASPPITLNNTPAQPTTTPVATHRKKSNRVLDQLADYNKKGLTESEVYPKPRLRGGKDY